MTVSAREIANIVFASPRDGWLCMLRAYFDDSGTHDQADVVVIGGLIGTDAIWSEFEHAWAARLTAPVPGRPSLKRFHMADCEAGQGEFACYNRAERDLVIHEFRQIILNSRAYGYAIAVSRKDWRDVIKADVQPALGDDELFCFADCVSRMREVAGTISDDPKLALIFDDRPHREAANRAVFAHYQLSIRNPYLTDIEFLSSEQILPLQGADMWAWETYRYSLDWLKQDGNVQPRPHLRHIHNSGRFESGVADRAALQAFVRIIRAELKRQGKDQEND